jgi:hypothetical protein
MSRYFRIDFIAADKNSDRVTSTVFTCIKFTLFMYDELSLPFSVTDMVKTQREQLYFYITGILKK